MDRVSAARVRVSAAAGENPVPTGDDHAPRWREHSPLAAETGHAQASVRLDAARDARWAAEAASLPAVRRPRGKALHVLLDHALAAATYIEAHAVDGPAPNPRAFAGADGRVGGLAEEIRALVAAIHRAQGEHVSAAAAARLDPQFPEEARAMIRQMRAGARWTMRMEPGGDAGAALARLAREHPKPRSHAALARALEDYATFAPAWSTPEEAEATRTRATEVAAMLRRRTAGRPATRRSREAREWLERLGCLLAIRLKRARGQP